jgi:hypothetical protein
LSVVEAAVAAEISRHQVRRALEVLLAAARDVMSSGAMPLISVRLKLMP